jgi:hypothetical protein
LTRSSSRYTNRFAGAPIEELPFYVAPLEAKVMTDVERNSNSQTVGPAFNEAAACDDPHDSWTSKGLAVWIAKVRKSLENDETMQKGANPSAKRMPPRKPRKKAA